MFFLARCFYNLCALMAANAWCLQAKKFSSSNLNNIGLKVFSVKHELALEAAATAIKGVVQLLGSMDLLCSNAMLGIRGRVKREKMKLSSRV